MATGRRRGEYVCVDDAAWDHFYASATPEQLAADEAKQERLNAIAEAKLDEWVRERDASRAAPSQPETPVAVVDRPKPRAREHGRSSTSRSSSGSDDSDPSDEPPASRHGAGAAARESRQLWAAVMLAVDVHVCESILLGRPVLVRQLDPVALRRALRGEPFPDGEAYFRVRAGHLDAVAEGGPFA